MEKWKISLHTIVSERGNDRIAGIWWKNWFRFSTNSLKKYRTFFHNPLEKQKAFSHIPTLIIIIIIKFFISISLRESDLKWSFFLVLYSLISKKNDKISELKLIKNSIKGKKMKEKRRKNFGLRFGFRTYWMLVCLKINSENLHLSYTIRYMLDHFSDEKFHE